MQNIKLEKREQDILINISRIISEEVQNLKDVLTTVVGIKLSSDLSHCNVYVTFSKNSKKNLERLNQASGYIKKQLSSILKWRKIPSLHFKIDDTFEKSLKIEQILEEIKKEK
ncbi:RIBOSOME-BINDING FACTOR A [Mycoplasmopsis pulmonis]|uniref:Ribosome-binding factor A n=1 Tax=Mycoplasmopsis pulmonis (strain UAB CTIP) TaxID=272635 RepID=RBFA_MYCPU|nr:30S ribosome-binding factor RbfA [Mycoplasmopsis pulmonis]Q98PP7.1 RecName: Full=Ribosome-binding factor A [Mycoplasmopsis pulmonis UAB CTIP]MDZ7293692.1 30S ribosome-binding factor RbfA [Mycoplasmopsis pulmonis]CAC13845.1 RIBOSOME-BINDING FACTOR A [Mycoplasmopsis pulmonis]VEU68439.1 Ribosome-binding factor A [Mycoplasmopsis pulmonis]